jgi:ABC-2 type transport system permease protein
MIGMLLFSTFTTNALVNPELIEGFQLSGINSLIEALNSSSFTMIAGIFVALFVCEDYAGQTIKNIYARGYSRKNVYLSKLITVLISTTVMLIIVDVAAFLIGTAFFGVGEIGNYKFLTLIGTQYIIAMAEITFAFTIASVIRKTGGAIACIIIAPMLIGVLLGLADVFINFENIYLSELWISNFLSAVSTLDVTKNRILLCIVGSLIYIPVFGAIGLYINKKIQL